MQYFESSPPECAAGHILQCQKSPVHAARARDISIQSDNFVTGFSRSPHNSHYCTLFTSPENGTKSICIPFFGLSIFDSLKAIVIWILI